MKTLMLLVGILLSNGCTVTPTNVVVKEPSFSGNSQNSGFLGYAPDGSGNWTFNRYLEYVDLVASYGYKFSPPIQNGEGIKQTTTNTVLIDKQHMMYFKQMLVWKQNKQ